MKPYPICRWAHAAIDAARELRLAHGITAGQVEAVQVNSFDYAASLFQGLPETTSKAQYSLPFPVATMLVHGRIGLEHISGAGLADPAVAAMVRRIPSSGTSVKARSAVTVNLPDRTVRVRRRGT